MHTFAQKPKPPQRATPVKSTARFLNLQLKTGDVRENFAPTQIASFGHDFSRIPLHAPAAEAIRSNLAIDKPKGEDGPEADRSAEQVMRGLSPIQLPAPRLNLRGFTVSSPDRSRPQDGKRTGYDKSRKPERSAQDRALSVTNFGARSGGGSGGVDIDLDASTGGTTAGRVGLGALIGGGIAGVGLGIAALAGVALTGGLLAGVLLGGAALGGLAGGLVGGYRYTQTIDTNAPMGGGSSPYVDPRPNDDDKPFYWTDSEEASHAGKFHDSPTRPVPGTGVTRWDAVVSITQVTGKSVKMMDSLKYGFSINPTGTVTPRTPVTANGGEVGTHVATLGSEFPQWTFKT